jgi:hypothetical protein
MTPSRFVPLLLLIVVAGCAHHRYTPEAAAPDSSRADASSPRTATSPNAPTTQPVLYHRTGGIAGTDDRVVIWPDGFVQVTGRILTPATGRLSDDRAASLYAMFAGWDNLQDSYQSAGVMDAYTITIAHGGKTVVADDLAPQLPERFRKLFSEIESIAASIASSDTAPRPIPPAPAASPDASSEPAGNP